MLHHPPPLEPEPAATRKVLGQWRIWRRERHFGRNPLPAMCDAEPDRAMLPAACDSFFSLIEACLHRPLQPADGPALLATLRAVPDVQGGRAFAAIPHGLPGALVWAGLAVLRELGGAAALGTARDDAEAFGQCPYGRSGLAA